MRCFVVCLHARVCFPGTLTLHFFLFYIERRFRKQFEDESLESFLDESLPTLVHALVTEEVHAGTWNTLYYVNVCAVLC